MQPAFVSTIDTERSPPILITLNNTGPESGNSACISDTISTISIPVSQCSLAAAIAQEHVRYLVFHSHLVDPRDRAIHMYVAAVLSPMPPYTRGDEGLFDVALEL